MEFWIPRGIYRLKKNSLLKAKRDLKWEMGKCLCSFTGIHLWKVPSEADYIYPKIAPHDL